MIRFESSESSASRNVPNAAKAASPTATARVMDTIADEAFSADGAEMTDDRGTDDKKARGRSRKMRG